jgi:hypothetical protein
VLDDKDVYEKLFCTQQGITKCEKFVFCKVKGFRTEREDGYERYCIEDKFDRAEGLKNGAYYNDIFDVDFYTFRQIFVLYWVSDVTTNVLTNAVKGVDIPKLRLAVNDTVNNSKQYNQIGYHDLEWSEIDKNVLNYGFIIENIYFKFKRSFPLHLVPISWSRS